MADADKLGDTTPPRMETALRILKHAVPSIADSLLAAALDQKILDHPGRIEEIRNNATLKAELIGKPAPAWNLPDLSGAHHTLAGKLGKVVVLDFWYRSCGWCIRAMPAMKQLADHYRDKPVAFFSMNVDSDAKDAQFVADFFKLPYPTLRTRFAPRNGDPTTGPADELVPAARYHVQVYPTLFIIGPDGVIRQMDVGYSPTMHDELAKQIDALLPTKAVSSASP